MADAIAAELGTGWTVQTRDQQVEEQSSALRQGLGFITYVLLGFSGISLFVAAFLIYNTFAMLVAQRGKEMALLRAVGGITQASSHLRAPGGRGPGAGGRGDRDRPGLWLGARAHSIAQTDRSVADIGVALTAQAVVWALVLAVVVTVASALLPAVRAARTPPLAALRESATPVERPGKVRTIVGLILLIVSGWGWWERSPTPQRRAGRLRGAGAAGCHSVPLLPCLRWEPRAWPPPSCRPAESLVNWLDATPPVARGGWRPPRRRC